MKLWLELDRTVIFAPSRGTYPDYFDRPALVYKDYLVIWIPGRHISSSRNAKQRRIKANNKVACELRWFWRHLYFGCHDKLPRLQLSVLPLAVCVQTRQSEKCPLYFTFSIWYPVTFFYQHWWRNIYQFQTRCVLKPGFLVHCWAACQVVTIKEETWRSEQHSQFFLPCFNLFQAFSDGTELSSPV